MVVAANDTLDFRHLDAESIFLGILPNGQPLLLPRSFFDEGMYISGGMGSGKTVLGFVCLIMQLAKEWNKVRRRIDGEIWPFTAGPGDERLVWQRQPKPPIVVIDVKGDPVLFNSCRIQAKNEGYDFKFFSVDPKFPGQIFDVFQNLQPCTVDTLAQLVLLALAMLHGDGYGKGHFTRANMARLSEVLLNTGNPTIRSWEHLYKLVIDRDNWRDLFTASDASELVNAIHEMMVVEKSLKNLSANGRSVDNRGVIHLPTALKKRQMIYFWLPPGIAPMTARYIGKFALFAVSTAAKALADMGQKIQTYCFVDEFHMIAGRHLEQILTQTRSSGVSLILANQYSSRLTEEDLDLRRMIFVNLRIKQFFTLTDPDEIDLLQKLSGQTIRLLKTEGRSENFRYNVLPGSENIGYSTQVSYRETLVPKFDAGIAAEATADPLGSIFWMSRDDGPIQFKGVPQYIRSVRPMSRAQYDYRNGFHRMPWPTPDDEPPSPATLPPPAPQGKPKPNDETIRRNQDILKQIRDAAEGKGTPAPKPKAKPKKEPPADEPPEPKSPSFFD